MGNESSVVVSKAVEVLPSVEENGLSFQLNLLVPENEQKNLKDFLCRLIDLVISKKRENEEGKDSVVKYKRTSAQILSQGMIESGEKMILFLPKIRKKNSITGEVEFFFLKKEDFKSSAVATVSQSGLSMEMGTELRKKYTENLDSYMKSYGIPVTRSKPADATAQIRKEATKAQIKEEATRNPLEFLKLKVLPMLKLGLQAAIPVMKDQEDGKNLVGPMKMGLQALDKIGSGGSLSGMAGLATSLLPALMSGGSNSSLFSSSEKQNDVDDDEDYVENGAANENEEEEYDNGFYERDERNSRGKGRRRSSTRRTRR